MLKVNMDGKVAYYLTLVEKNLYNIRHYPWYPLVRETINMCWEWVEEKKYDGYALYERIDDEETGLFAVHMNEVDAGLDDPKDELVFFCVMDAVAYTVWQAYQYEEKDYVPQAIEVINDEFIESELMGKISKVNGYQEEWAERLKDTCLKCCGRQWQEDPKRENMESNINRTPEMDPGLNGKRLIKHGGVSVVDSAVWLLPELSHHEGFRQACRRNRSDIP